MPGPTFLTGEHVTLHPPTEADLEFISANRNDPQLRATRSELYPVGREDALRYVGGRLGRRDETVAQLVCADGDPVGLVLLIREKPNDAELRRAELAFWTTPEAQDQGYATDAARTIVGYGFDRLGLHKVIARTYETNPASTRVLKKLGFRQEGTLREEAFVDGEWIDVGRYGLLAEEWRGETVSPA